MATKSILKQIYIKDRELGNSLIYALENAEKYTGKQVKLSKSCREISGEEINKIFGDQQK